MPSTGTINGRLKNLEEHGLMNLARVHWNLSTAELYEEIARRREGLVAHLGPVVIHTGEHTGRSPRDKFIVQEPSSVEHIWWGDINQPLAPEHFETLKQRFFA